MLCCPHGCFLLLCGCSPPPGLHTAPPISSIPYMIPLCSSISILEHTIFSPFGLYLDLHFQGVCKHPAEQVSIKLTCCIQGFVEGDSKIQNIDLLVLFITAVLTNSFSGQILLPLTF